MNRPLNELYSQLDLYEPGLGYTFRSSTHAQMLAHGQGMLTTWEASHLNYFYGPHVARFNALIEALRLPAKLASSVTRQTSSQTAWWMSSLSQYERIERVHVARAIFELNYADKHGRYQLHLAAPPLDAEKATTALEWLTADPSQPLRAVAKGEWMDVAVLQQLKLLPTWESLLVSLDTRQAGALELGVRFFGRALVTYPAFIWLWRGLDGEVALRNFAEKRLAQRQADFERAAAALPSTVAEFWAAPPLPELPALTDIAPALGLGAHLSSPSFWPKPDDNLLFLRTALKVYKAVPKKVLRMVKPKPQW